MSPSRFARRASFPVLDSIRLFEKFIGIYFSYNTFLRMKNLLSKFFNKNGLIVTLLLGLIVSVVASRIENLIQKQRYLELLQIEIRTNYLTALRTINATASELSTQTFPYFSTAVYEAGLESGYILTIVKNLQDKRL